MNKYFLFFLIISCFFTSKTFAADVSFQVEDHIEVADSFYVDIIANTDGELVNSIETTIEFPEDLVIFSGYKNEGVLKLWIEAPYEKNGRVYFSGIVPGGVNGFYDANSSVLLPIKFVRLFFVAKKAGEGSFSLKNTQLLKNDGKGSLMYFEERGVSFSVQPNLNSGEENSIKLDNEPPLPFEITYLKYSFFSKTPSLLLFETTDKKIGVKEYQMKVDNGLWSVVKSPKSIDRGILGHLITIKALDFNNNAKEAYIYIPGIITVNIVISIFVGLIFIIWLYKLLLYK
ncbi:MAG: hypothetical protein AAB438_01560 [Patescibacteria group bacterium]